jgi:hypothetical protein
MSPNSKGEEKKKVNNNNILYIIYILYIFFFLTEEISFEFFWRFWGFFWGFFRGGECCVFFVFAYVFCVVFRLPQILAVLSQIAEKLSIFCE